MDNEDDFDIEDNEVGGNEMGFEGGADDIEDNFEADFDAGVEANEEENPKKFIEQLSGKLSQSLRKYQENLPQPDADTAKFAAGMVIKAALDGLSDDDVKDILNKVKEADTEEPSESSNDNEMNDGEGMQEELPNDEFPSEEMTESIMKIRQIDEIFNQIMNDRDQEDISEKPLGKVSFKKKPFTSPNF